MTLRKKSRIIALIFSLLLSVTMLFSSAITVFAEGEQQAETYESYMAKNNVDEKLIVNDIIDTELSKVLADIYQVPNDPAKLSIAKYLYEEILGTENSDGTVLYYKACYSDANIKAEFEPLSVPKAKDARDEALANCYFKGEDLINVNYLEYFADAKADMIEAFGELAKIQERDREAFLKLVDEAINGKAKEVDGETIVVPGITQIYTERAAKAKKVTYKSSLKTIYDEYIAKIDAIEYDAPNVNENKNDLKELTKEAIAAIKAAPINDIENAMVLYNDLLSLLIKNEDITKIQQASSNLESAARTADREYKSSSDPDYKLEYSDEYVLILAFLDSLTNDPVDLLKTSELTDKYGVIKITATDWRGNPINAIPVNCELILYQTKNAAARRNASLAIKEKDSKLSVAYFVSIWITKGAKKYELPTKTRVINGVDANGNVTDIESEVVDYEVTENVYVTYEIEFDVKKYYEKYLAKSEKDLFSNIIDANNHINELQENKPFICYGYKAGNDNLVDLKNISFDDEGGVLVFNTNAHLNSFFLAGTGIESYFNNPIFWVIVAAALVLLFIIIKLVIKHWKYTIKFKTNGGSYVAKVRASKGEYFVLPTNPVKNGYVFAGWYVDKALTVRFVGNCMTRRRNIKLYAKWAAPVSRERMLKYYDVLRDTMCSYKKESFKSLLGLAETEFIASMAMRENYLQLNLALNIDDLRNEGVAVLAAKGKRYAEVPVQLNISTEEMFMHALDLTKRVLVNKGLQRIEDYVPVPPSTEEERQRGFAFIIHNERVAKTAEDYFELLRIAVKSYVLENDLGKFKPGDKVTLARIYVTNEVACLHLPKVKGVKGLKASRRAPFADTPVIFKVLTPKDMLEAYALIDKIMKANGFVKRPENANDLIDVKVPATNGFAYTLIF